MTSLCIFTAAGKARADRHVENGRVVAYVVRWELADGSGGSTTFPAHADGVEARGLAWRAAFDAGDGRPPQSAMVRSSWPVLSVQWKREAA